MTTESTSLAPLGAVEVPRTECHQLLDQALLLPDAFEAGTR